MKQKLWLEIQNYLRGLRAHLEANRIRWDPTVYGSGEKWNSGGIAQHVIVYEGTRNKRKPEAVKILATRIKCRETAKLLTEMLWPVKDDNGKLTDEFRLPTWKEADGVLKRISSLKKGKLMYKQVYLGPNRVGKPERKWFFGDFTS